MTRCPCGRRLRQTRRPRRPGRSRRWTRCSPGRRRPSRSRPRARGRRCPPCRPPRSPPRTCRHACLSRGTPEPPPTAKMAMSRRPGRYRPARPPRRLRARSKARPWACATDRSPPSRCGLPRPCHCLDRHPIRQPALSEPLRPTRSANRLEQRSRCVRTAHGRRTDLHRTWPRGGTPVTTTSRRPACELEPHCVALASVTVDVGRQGGDSSLPWPACSPLSTWHRRRRQRRP